MGEKSALETKSATRLDFEELASLRLICKQILQEQSTSLQYFEFEEGYQHYHGKNKISVSSTATCVLSLVATGEWVQDKQRGKANTKALIQKLVQKKKSAGLEEHNPFTEAWILEAVSALASLSDPWDKATSRGIKEKETLLQKEIEKGHGGVSIAQYPASPYLTQLVVRALRRRDKLGQKLELLVSDWSWKQLTRELSLAQTKSKSKDPFAYAYLLMLVTSVTPVPKISPERSSIQRAALEIVFESQLPDGTWPLSRPLFHYPNFGNAYCYDYEMLTQLLLQPGLQDLLLEYLPKLRLSAIALAANAYRLENGGRAWASGHHPQLDDPEKAGPESWTTASVYHFIHRLDRLLAEAVRLELFRYLEIPFPRSAARRTKESEFATHFLDSEVEIDGTKRSLKRFLWEHFVKPLRDAAVGVELGQAFGKEIPRSAIFFGPPGTAKTELAREIAGFLGWPHLALDPSHFLRSGMDGIQAEANKIFHMLEQTERVVVLFDEFDELVRERGSSNAEPLSRFLTTAMLPKFARLHKAGTLVFIIATNNIGEFDLAIRREGRFDRVLQMMPPTYDAKLSRVDWGFKEKLNKLGVQVTSEIKKQLEELTYGECDTLAGNLAKMSDKQAAIKLIDDRWKKCTLQTHVSKVHVRKEDETTWAERCKTEAIHNR